MNSSHRIELDEHPARGNNEPTIRTLSRAQSAKDLPSGHCFVLSSVAYSTFIVVVEFSIKNAISGKERRLLGTSLAAVVGTGTGLPCEGSLEETEGNLPRGAPIRGEQLHRGLDGEVA